MGLIPAGELACIAATVASVLDVSVTLYRVTGTTNDGYGHTVPTWTSQGTVKVNIIKPSATQLQAFAGIIGSQWALMIRFMQTTDIREGDQIDYNGRRWTVNNVQDAESYTVTREALVTVVV